MKTTIEYLRFETRFGRNIGFASLCNEDGKILIQGSLAEIIQYVDEENLVIDNSQEILTTLLRLGYAS
jgi:hypothetical protein